MGVKERREREKSEVRDKILDAARELFISEGYEGVSMRSVAEKIEYSATAIYAYFADKEELFRELCYEDFGRLAEVFTSAALPSDPVEKLRFIGKTYADFGFQFPNHYKLMFMTAHPHAELDERDQEIRGNPESDAYAFLRLTVVEALASGCFRDEVNNPDLIAQTLWAGIHGVISLNIAKSHDGWVDWRPLNERVDLMLDVTLRGLLKERK